MPKEGGYDKGGGIIKGWRLKPAREGSGMRLDRLAAAVVPPGQQAREPVLDGAQRHRAAAAVRGAHRREAAQRQGELALHLAQVAGGGGARPPREACAVEGAGAHGPPDGLPPPAPEPLEPAGDGAAGRRGVAALGQQERGLVVVVIIINIIMIR